MSSSGAAVSAADVGCLLTVQDVAQRLSVPATWVYAQAESGALPSFKIGKYRRFSERDLEHYLAAQRQVRGGGQ
jgi:excisionase family DNA binding protein